MIARSYIKREITNNNVGEGLVPSRYPSRKSTRLKNFNYAQTNAVFFITLCSLGKKQVFVRNDFNMEVIWCINKERERINHAVYVFCLMSNHIHLLCSPRETGIPITQFIGALSSRVTRLSWKYGFSGSLLQRSFYDHVVRKDEDLRKIAEYILNNPVRKGLAEKWQDYQYGGFIDPLPV
jgi:putative transposase